MVIRLDTQNFLHWGCNDKCKINTAKGIAAVCDMCSWSTYGYFVAFNFDKVCLFWGKASAAFPLKPAAVTEFHIDLFSASDRVFFALCTRCRTEYLCVKSIIIVLYHEN